MSDLRDLFCKRLCEYCAFIDSITRGHSTRLKQNILKNIPGLCEHKQGRDILLIFEENAGDAILHACVRSGESDGFCLAKAANIIRKQLFVDQQDPEGALEPLHKQLGVPASLFSLISMLLDGGSIYRNLQQSFVGFYSRGQGFSLVILKHLKGKFEKLSQ